jgi:hypothetical protein
MQRGYTQGIAVFAGETSKLLVNRGSNEVVNITSTEMMKNWFAGSMCSVIARSVSDEAIQSFLSLDCFAEPVIGRASRDPLARNDDQA